MDGPANPRESHKGQPALIMITISIMSSMEKVRIHSGTEAGAMLMTTMFNKTSCGMDIRDMLTTTVPGKLHRRHSGSDPGPSGMITALVEVITTNIRTDKSSVGAAGNMVTWLETAHTNRQCLL